MTPPKLPTQLPLPLPLLLLPGPHQYFQLTIMIALTSLAVYLLPINSLSQHLPSIKQLCKPQVVQFNAQRKENAQLLVVKNHHVVTLISINVRMEVAKTELKLVRKT